MGRPRIYTDNAAKQKAYRERLKASAVAEARTDTHVTAEISHDDHLKFTGAPEIPIWGREPMVVQVASDRRVTKRNQAVTKSEGAVTKSKAS